MRTILFLVIVSGFIAYVGDRLGFRVGKLRLSVFGLRPRNTAILISILTGMLITLVSFGFLAMVSEEARIGLFQIERIRANLATLRDENAALESDRDRLSAEVRILDNDLFHLRKQVDALKSGELVFQKDEVLGYLPLAGGGDPAKALAEVRGLIANGRATVEKLGMTVKPLEEIWAPMAGTIETFVRALEPGARVVFVLRSRERVAKGEELSLNLQAVAETVLFHRGDALDGDIDATGDRESIRRQVLAFYDEISDLALEKGMLLDPLRTLDPFETLDLVNELKRRGGRQRLSVVVGADIGVTGPFIYALQISPAN